MTLPVLTALAIIFILWINYEIHKTSKQLKEDSGNFWEREKASNLSRRTDITSLNYITISTQRLPMEDSDDLTVNSYRDTILSLSGQKAINLSNLTNTELKLQYGVANLNQLTDYDNNYTVLVSILQKWAERLSRLELYHEATAVLEYAVHCHTDVGKTYLLLAQIYNQLNNQDKIKSLINIIKDTKLYDKDKLISDLTKIMNF